MPRTILLVDDDALLRRSLAFHLERAGYQALTASNAEDALQMIQQRPVDLVLLDISLPGQDGLDALHELKARYQLPVIFLTARRRELDEVVGLESGADDYITKPFDVDVLLAHVRAVLRRYADKLPHETSRPAVSAGDLQVDPVAHTATRRGQPLELSPREFDLLYALVSQAGQAVSTEDLLSQVWGAEFVGQPQVVYVHVRWLRLKIEDDPNHPTLLLTVRGIGYRLVPNPTA